MAYTTQVSSWPLHYSELNGNSATGVVMDQTGPLPQHMYLVRWSDGSTQQQVLVVNNGLLSSQLMSFTM